jgi:hypothetical protein
MLEKLSRAKREPSVHVVRAQLLLAVAKGTSYSEAAQSARPWTGGDWELVTEYVTASFTSASRVF